MRDLYLDDSDFQHEWLNLHFFFAELILQYDQIYKLKLLIG